MSELYIPIERPQYNPTNGQFLKGHVPHNRGKKMKDYLDEETIKRIKETGIKNLKPNLKVCGWNKKAIIAMDDDNKILGWFSSSCDAEKRRGYVQGTSDKLVMASGNTQVGLNGNLYEQLLSTR